MVAVVSSKMGDAAVLELTAWVSSFGPVGMTPSMLIGLFVSSIVMSAGRAGTPPPRVNISSVGGDTYDRDVIIYRWWLIIVGSTSRVTISSVGGDIYDRDIVIYRWWLIVVRRRVIFIDI